MSPLDIIWKPQLVIYGDDTTIDYFTTMKWTDFLLGVFIYLGPPGTFSSCISILQ